MAEISKLLNFANNQRPQSLQKNLKINSVDAKVVAYNIAVGNARGHVKLTKGMDTINHVISDLEGALDYIEVAIEKIDDIALSNGVPVLMKIDVEGFESEVLQGMPKVLQSPNLKAIIIELNTSSQRYGKTDGFIHEMLIDAGFKSFHYNPFKRELTSAVTYGSHNTLYIRDVEYVSQRVAMADSFSVFGEMI